MNRPGVAHLHGDVDPTSTTQVNAANRVRALKAISLPRFFTTAITLPIWIVTARTLPISVARLTPAVQSTLFTEPLITTVRGEAHENPTTWRKLPTPTTPDYLIAIIGHQQACEKPHVSADGRCHLDKLFLIKPEVSIERLAPGATTTSSRNENLKLERNLLR